MPHFALPLFQLDCLTSKVTWGKYSNYMYVNKSRLKLTGINIISRSYTHLGQISNIMEKEIVWI